MIHAPIDLLYVELIEDDSVQVDDNFLRGIRNALLMVTPFWLGVAIVVWRWL